jgi:hypothetical protein
LKIAWQFLKKIRVTIGPINPAPGYMPKRNGNMSKQKLVCELGAWLKEWSKHKALSLNSSTTKKTRMLTASLFMITQRYEQPKLYQLNKQNVIHPYNGCKTE